MILVTGTKRSGTSMWMHVLAAAGLPIIGDRFPQGWGELMHAANPDGFFESELMAGIYFRTNPHPLTGAYLAPAATRYHAVKVFIPGLVRTDVAFIERCVATVRPWREYVASLRRVRAMQPPGTVPAPEDGLLPPALEWWCNNYALLRDLAIRGYPIHVVSYDALLRDPERVIAEVLAWIGQGDPQPAAAVVRPELRTTTEDASDASDDLVPDIEPQHLAVFDALYEVIDTEQPLTHGFVEQLNRTHDALRPMVLEYEANADAQVVADVLGRG